MMVNCTEGDDDDLEDDLSRSMAIDGTATAQDQESWPSELEDETITGIETENEIINEPNQPHCEKFPSKKIW